MVVVYLFGRLVRVAVTLAVLAMHLGLGAAAGTWGGQRCGLPLAGFWVGVVVGLLVWVGGRFDPVKRRVKGEGSTIDD